MLVSLFLSWLKNDRNSYYLLMNIRGFSSFLDYYKAVVNFIGGVIIAGLGFVFRVSAFRDNI